MPGNKLKLKAKIEREGRFGQFKSRRRLRLTYVKVPGGRTVVQFRLKKPSKAKCAVCQKVLLGVPWGTPSQMKNLPKTAKRPQRPYGGVLCSQCVRQLFKTKARAENELV